MKPTILIMEETKESIMGAINGAIKSGVPCYLLEPMLTDFLVQVKSGAKMELENAKAQYEKEVVKDENIGAGCQHE